MSSLGITRLIGVPSVCPSKTPDRILTVSVSLRWVTRALWPGLRRSRSGWMSASDKGSRGGQPSTTAPVAPPCDSPHVVTRKSCPQVLPMRRAYAEIALRQTWPTGVRCQTGSSGRTRSVEEGTMEVSRREMAVAGAAALAVPGMLLGAFSVAEAAADESAVIESVEVLRKAIFDADKAKLDQVASPQISYGHSDGRVETKEQFINGVMTRKQTVKSLAFPELKVAVVGDAAIARHIYLAESELEGKQTTTKIGALQVWQKQNGSWKLLARQGFRLPAPA